MKKIQNSSLSILSIRLYLILLLLISGSITLSAQSFAKVSSKHISGGTDIIEKSFKNTFPNTEKAIWSEKEKCYTSLLNEMARSRTWYNKRGEAVKTQRYCRENELSPFMLAKIKENYAGKTIFGVTEVNSKEGIYYYIVLEDDKKWYHIKADGSGNLSMENEYNEG